MHRRKEAQGSFQFKSNFTGTGRLGNESYDVKGHVRLIMQVEGVGVTNVIKVYGRLRGATTWLPLTSSPPTGLTGPTAAPCSVTVSAQCEEVKFECETFEADGTPLLLVAGSFA